ESGGSFWQNCHLLPLPTQNRGEGGGARRRHQCGALRDGGGRGWGQDGEGIEGVRFPLLPRAGVEQGGRFTGGRHGSEASLWRRCWSLGGGAARGGGGCGTRRRVRGLFIAAGRRWGGS